MNDFDNAFSAYVNSVNKSLEKYLPADGTKIIDSMRYSVMAGGKRIRPVLTLECCRVCGGDTSRAMPFACALEIIHTYSLIFDDMPCMDNDSLRRGKPTNHVVFGEDMALMAGMGLYARAFEAVIAENKSGLLSDAQTIAGIDALLNASGVNGIVRGQVLDMENISSNKQVDRAFLEKIHNKKTSAMLEACAILGCIAANDSGERSKHLLEYSKAVGLAFQIRDDILDVISTSADMGKTVGKDSNDEKITFVDILGVDGAQKEVEALSAKAESLVSDIPDNAFLLKFADMLCRRDH